MALGVSKHSRKDSIDLTLVTVHLSSLFSCPSFKNGTINAVLNNCWPP